MASVETRRYTPSPDLAKTDRASSTLLYLVSGKTTKVHKADGKNYATIAYRDTLPVDLMPLLVLDASGRVRQTYTDMAANRSIIERLPSEPKDYGPLTVHVWNQSGSKTAWNNREELVSGIVETIQSKPDQEWLVVHHKAKKGIPDIPREIRSRVGDAIRDPLHNVGPTLCVKSVVACPQRDPRRVPLLSTLADTATTHLAKGQPVEAGDVTREEVDRD